MSYQLEFENKSLIALGIGALLLGIVLFFAGFFTEALLAKRSLPLETIPSYPGSKRPPDGTPAPKDSAPTPPASISVSVPGPHVAADLGAALQLAVQVGTFAEPEQAKFLATQLQKQGFSPVIAPRVSATRRQLSVVEIGPFSAWEDASHVAQLIGRSFGTRPVIRPML